MIRNYFKIAWRNLIKNRSYALINIGGLAVGMAVAVLIGLWIHYELSINKSFENHDHIAQIRHHLTINGNDETWDAVPAIMSKELRNKYGDDFEYVAQAWWDEKHTLSFEDKNFLKIGSYFEPDITKILSLTMLNGSREGLIDVNTILISESLSKLLFGEKDPYGEMLKLDNEVLVKVTGVYKDFPENSSFRDLDFMLSWGLFLNQNPWIKEQMNQQNPWYPGGNMRTFVQINRSTTHEKVSLKIKDIVSNNLSEVEKHYQSEIVLHPMSKWYLHANFENRINTGGRIDNLWLFGIVGVFVLLLACINFMNLSTAQSEKRAKEVGIRKTLGSHRRQLISQFFSESILVSFIAYLFSILLASLFLPVFNNIADSNIDLIWNDILFWILGFMFSLLVGVIAGAYPALYLTSFKPVKVLKGVFKTGQQTSRPRQILVVSQFAISIMLIIGAVIVYQQVKHAENRELGYDKNGLINISTTAETHNNIQNIRSTLINNGAILEMAESRHFITNEWNQAGGFEWEGKDPEIMGNFHIGFVSFNYGKTIGWEIKEGRDFSRTFSSDSTQFILNESAIQHMNLKDPIGKIIRNGSGSATIVGVVKDFIIESPYQPIKPYIYVLNKIQGNTFMLKLNPERSVKESLAKIESVFRSYNPSKPFEVSFVDEAHARKFGNEKRVGKLVSLFTILAIFISCLGLFGLASYVAEQRIKEIGIRKILGASIFRLWKMLSKDFLILVIIACAIAVPVGYYVMDGWLQKFEYRTSISWWVSILACGSAVIVTLITVSYQGIKAANSNPIKSLKTE